MKFLSQGWFSSANFIPPDEFSLSGMILPRWFHPSRWIFSLRDDSPLLISSLQMKILSQGWFSPASLIPPDEFSLSGMILIKQASTQTPNTPVQLYKLIARNNRMIIFLAFIAVSVWKLNVEFRIRIGFVLNSGFESDLSWISNWNDLIQIETDYNRRL